MNPNSEMCESLISWFQSIAPNRVRNIDEICDGVAMLDSLIQIAPEYFNKLEAKIKRDVSSSWRLKVSNLKKILEAITEYYQEVLTLQLLEQGRPDVTEIGANNDRVQLAKLLRLILGCAINCDRKQDYITKIMKMEEAVQQNIMQAIQQLEQVTGGRSGLSLLILDSDSRTSRLLAELEAATEAKDTLAHQCQDLEAQIKALIDEKHALRAENQALNDKTARNNDFRKHNDELKEELFKAEVLRDDFKAKMDDQARQIKANLEKIAELQQAANESARLKDEVDALSESAVKAQLLETNLASYKKKLEKYSDAKKSLQKLEEKNMEYLQKTLRLEEELATVGGWKNQCESYKKQLADVEARLDEETQRADKAQFNAETLATKMAAVQGEKERALQDRDALREEVEELKMGGPRGAGAAMAAELTPTELRERLRFVERENRALKAAQQEGEASRALLESAQSRIEKLQAQVRAANQRVLKLEAQLEEGGAGLQEALAAKEGELNAVQGKYSRSLEKAREVAQQLEVKSSNGRLGSLMNQGSHMKEIEERMIVAAFNRLGLNCHREAIDERLAMLNAGQGQSFLERQRQPTPRKQNPKIKFK